MSADDWTSGGVKRDGADAGPGFPDDRERFEAGDKAALLWVIMICAQTNWRMPEWAREAFYEIYWTAASGEIESWDDLFGKPWGPGQQRAAVTNHKAPYIWRRVRLLHTKEDAPIDNELFERVGKEFGVSRSVASRLYYGLEGPFKKELDRDPQLRKILGRD
jgi:hypothetical protein